MAVRVDLKVQKDLINPQFDSYKLSLDPLPTYHQEFEKVFHGRVQVLISLSGSMAKVNTVKPLYVGQECFNLDKEGSLLKRLKAMSARRRLIGFRIELGPLPIYKVQLPLDISTLALDQLTSHHAKLFVTPNHLVPDPWIENSVYVVDCSWTVRNVFIRENDKVDNSRHVFDIPDASEFRQVPGRVNVSLCFAGQQFAVLADGAGRLFLLNTNDRKQRTGQWKVLLKEQVLGENTAFSVVDAAHYISSAKQDTVECLLVSVEDANKEQHQSHHLTVITWITLSADPAGTWSVSRTRRLEGPRPFEYASVERGGGGVTIASNRPFTMTADSVKEISQSEGAGEGWEIVGREPQQPLYTWSQTAEDITVQLTLPADTAKPDVYVSLAHDHVDIGVKNTVALLRGQLRDRIDVSTGTWNIEGQKLEVSFMKEKENMWDLLVVGDTRGEMTMDEATIAAIHERLKHLTSDKWNPDPDQDNKPYNTQQLEDCDAVDDEECIYLTRIDGETHQISHQATVSYNLLFRVGLEADKAPALCLRHDVDGLLWQPEAASSLTGGTVGSNCPWRHCGTLDAFGYVQASKTQRRFSSCAPDFSLAAVADYSRHVYLYRQRAPVANSLRNRRTSRDVNAVAKQHVVVIDPPDPIFGLHVSTDHVFVATASCVHAVKVSQNA